MKNFVQTGDNLAFLASELVAPSHTLGDTYTNLVAPGFGITTPVNLVETGDPVLVGRIGGVANQDALQSSDTVVVSTRGVYSLPVVCYHHSIVKGETVYADPSTVVLSDDSSGVPFGCALDAVGVGAATTIRVKLFGQTGGALGANS